MELGAAPRASMWSLLGGLLARPDRGHNTDSGHLTDELEIELVPHGLGARQLAVAVSFGVDGSTVPGVAREDSISRRWIWLTATFRSNCCDSRRWRWARYLSLFQWNHCWSCRNDPGHLWNVDVGIKLWEREIVRHEQFK